MRSGRVLRPGASARTGRLVRAGSAGLLLTGALLVGSGVAGLAQEPSIGPVGSDAPSATPGTGVAVPVDPRSTGEGPGLEAEPLIVLLGVVGLGIAAAGGTVIFVRLTRDD